jgi:pSer/pThr/pTyr-binding forkhead associated (FHA) protein
MIALRSGTDNSDYDSYMDEEPETIPPNAFFVMEGGKIYPLDQAVINIGRMLDNHLVIDDPRVSRHHAQVRAVQGHFVLADLNSTGGIFVNGRRVTETIVYPNDSISLAGVILTFQQDEPPPRPDLADTIQ